MRERFEAAPLDAEQVGEAIVGEEQIGVDRQSAAQLRFGRRGKVLVDQDVARGGKTDGRFLAAFGGQLGVISQRLSQAALLGGSLAGDEQRRNRLPLADEHPQTKLFGCCVILGSEGLVRLFEQYVGRHVFPPEAMAGIGGGQNRCGDDPTCGPASLSSGAAGDGLRTSRTRRGSSSSIG